MSATQAPWFDRLAEPVLTALVAGLNHVLDQQPAALERLRMFRSRLIRLGIDPARGSAAVQLWMRIDDDGRLRVEGPGQADVQMLVHPSAQAFFDTMRDGARGLSTHLRIEGDVMLAACLGELVQNVRWDAEEDLSRVVGDMAAHRIAGTGRALRELLADGGARVGRQLGGWIETGGAPLATSAQFDDLTIRARMLAQRVDGLERRIDEESHR